GDGGGGRGRAPAGGGGGGAGEKAPRHPGGVGKKKRHRHGVGGYFPDKKPPLRGGMTYTFMPGQCRLRGGTAGRRRSPFFPAVAKLQCNYLPQHRNGKDLSTSPRKRLYESPDSRRGRVRRSGTLLPLVSPPRGRDRGDARQPRQPDDHGIARLPGRTRHALPRSE